MAIPTTGSVALLDTAGTTRSISREVLGNATPSKIYASLVAIAGFSLPKSYTSWRGYSSGTGFALNTGLNNTITPEIAIAKSTFFGKQP